MTTQPTSLTEYYRKAANNRMGLWLFLISDTFVFAGLFVARFALLGAGTRPEVNQFVGLAITLILLISSFFINRAETAMRFGDRKMFFIGTLITIVLGLVFLLGVVILEWMVLAPSGPNGGAVWTIFYAMTGFHALHVLSGIIFLFVIFRNARKGLYNEERHFPVEGAAVYWHFVDVVWIFYYPALYLIGSAVR